VSDPYRTAEVARFVQIAAGKSDSGSSLFALDAEGQVWTYHSRRNDGYGNTAEGFWEALATLRKKET
jgi:hypothetical protein